MTVVFPQCGSVGRYSVSLKLRDELVKYFDLSGLCHISNKFLQ